jgi:carbonic anhydrase/acetyltransferase-like protein (isoleucine patch superfamily)
MIRDFEQSRPRIDTGAYIDETALVIGDVHIGKDSSLWPYVVARGDVNRIRIGARTNLQDHSIVHVTHDSEFNPGGFATLIGDDVTVGHRVTLHGCRLGDRILVGMDSVILDGVEIGDDTIIGAGTLVTQNKKLEGGYLWLGRPARRMRALSDEERSRLSYSAEHYVRLKDRHLKGQVS